MSSHPLFASNREAIASAKLVFSDFIQYDFSEGKYGERIRRMLEKEETRLLVNLGDLREYDSDIAKKFLLKPSIYIPAFEQALREYIDRLTRDDKKLAASIRKSENEFTIGVEGSFGGHQLTPRELNSRFLGTLVNVEGIVTKASTIQPKLVRSVHYCEKTGMHSGRQYTDSLSTAYPTKDEEGNPLSTEYGFSVYRDHQTLTIQEMPEKAPPGQLPYSVEVVVTDDMVDKCHPGDRVEISGVFKPLPWKHGSHTSAIFKSILVGNNVALQKKDIGPTVGPADISNIKKISQLPDLFHQMSRSLAPSVFGHDFVKKALLLQLLGGVEKNLTNQTHLRGDINILLIGDPSTAKSQLLRFVLHTAPLSVSTTGRGSSGVGLTAAVVHDTDTGERRLEAGAMVLADRGVVCIDEFDKMSNDDRVAIHEVMEQQTVTIAKAGIHTALNARCSVLAAANPIYGQYNRLKKPTENIALPDSLLSRFDLLFIVLDTLNPEHDRSISDHVLRMHRYNKVETENFASHNKVSSSNNNNNSDENEATPVWEKFDKLLHGGTQHRNERLFSIEFVKKYILYAKNNIKPQLTEEASECINQAYVQLRNKDDMKTLPVTARTLETLIRLATAHAKLRLADQVLKEDAEAAMELVNYALYRDTTRLDLDESISSSSSTAPSSSNKSGSSASQTKTNASQSSEDITLKKRKVDRTSKPQKEESDSEEELHNRDEMDEFSQVDQLLQASTSETKSSSSLSSGTAPQARRTEMIRKGLLDLLNKLHTTECTINDLLDFLNSRLAPKQLKFESPEVEEELETMVDENKVLVADNMIYQL